MKVGVCKNGASRAISNTHSACLSLIGNLLFSTNRTAVEKRDLSFRKNKNWKHNTTYVCRKKRVSSRDTVTRTQTFSISLITDTFRYYILWCIKAITVFLQSG